MTPRKMHRISGIHISIKGSTIGRLILKHEETDSVIKKTCFTAPKGIALLRVSMRIHYNKLLPKTFSSTPYNIQLTQELQP